MLSKMALKPVWSESVHMYEVGVHVFPSQGPGSFAKFLVLH